MKVSRYYVNLGGSLHKAVMFNYYVNRPARTRAESAEILCKPGVYIICRRNALCKPIMSNPETRSSVGFADRGAS